MRIGIDCRLAGRKHAGIGRYVTELVRHLVNDVAKNDRATATNQVTKGNLVTATNQVAKDNLEKDSRGKTITWVLTVTSQKQARELLPEDQPSSVEWVIAPIQHYTLKEQLVMPRVFAKQKLDLLHVPHFNLPILYALQSFVQAPKIANPKIVITIHDLLWHQQRGAQVTTLPSWQYWLKYSFYRLVVKNTVTAADTIITPTQVVKKEVINFYPKVADKIEAVAEGISINLKASQKPNLKLPQDFLLYVGSLYPHKNLAVVLRALVQKPEERLVIASARSVFTTKLVAEAQKLKVEQQVTPLTNIDDPQLVWLYQHARAVVQPSLSEGFGLTGLEAMA